MKVPTYDNFQATPNALPQTRLGIPDMPDIAGRQAQQMGHSMQRFGGEIGQIALDMQAQANQVRVDDALNRVKEEALRLTYDKDAGFTNLKGINALERPDGKPLADEYSDTLRQNIEEIAGTLGNDAQRRAFGLYANNILTSMRGSAIQHEAQEFKTYSLSVSEGIQSTALREIGLSWNNPDAVNSAVERIRAETYRQAQLLGKSAEWQEAAARKMTSNAHKVALLTALEQNDPSYADAYLKKYSEQMDADDILTVRGHVTKATDIQESITAVNEVMSKMQPRIQTSEAERAFNILLGTESNYRQFGPDGKPLTSPKGAIGIAQVMPDTAQEAAKLAGLPWDENRYKNDPGYNKALGMAYFQKQLQDNGGDLAKAYAAYNAGPGRLAEAVKKAEQSARLGQTDPKLKVFTWLDFMPKETRDYAAKNMREFDAGQGQAKRPTFQEIDEELRANPRLASNPSRYKVAREEAERQFNDQTKAIKQREEEAVIQAQEELIANGGNFAELPASVQTAIPPDKYDDLLTYAGKIAKGQPVTTDWDIYTKLRAMAANEPDKFGETDLRLFYPKLAPEQRKQLLDIQIKVKDPDQQPDVLTLSQQLAIAHNQLNFGKGDSVKKGRFDNAVSQEIASEMRNKKRDLTFEERDKIIKRLMLPVTSGGWIEFGTSRLYESIGTSQESSYRPKISDDDRKLISAALRAEGILPTEENITSRFNLRYGIR